MSRETVLVYTDSTCELHENEAAYVEAPERLGAALRGVEEARRAGITVEQRQAEPASSRALEAVHSASYLERLGGLAAKGGGTLDWDTAMGPGSLEAATAASGCAIAAVEGALSGAPSYAVVRPPGHHAGPDYAMGFCLLNHAAVAAGHARRGGVERVAILDWDVHHGNGTQDVFYRADGVLYLSAHRAPPFYPGTGEPWETGKEAGEGLTANVALPGGAGEDLYASVFSGFFLPLLREFRPGLLVISAGYDAHFADPLGGMRLSDDSFGRFAATLAALCRELDAPPPALVLEGGYNLGALSGSVAATLRGLVEERPPPLPEDPSGELPGPVAESRQALAPFWGGLR